MRISTTFIALAAPFLASALPFKRTASANDLLVMKFAHVLEQLETQFYSEALQKFQVTDFTSAGFVSSDVAVQQFTAIQIDESTHTTVLESLIQSLGDQPISGCTFNFDSILTDVTTMAATARVVENLGVAAYLGAAHLLDDPVLLTDAASIVTVEARHQTVLNILNGGSAIPQAFDIPFSPSQVLAIAGSFISGCDVGVPANPSLAITNTGTVAPGTSLTFSSSALNGSVSTDSLFCQMMLGGAPFAIALPYNQCVVPAGVNGPVAIYVTSDGQPLANNIRDQATNSLLAGPTMAYIDTVPEALSALVRTSAGAPAAASAAPADGSSTASASASTSTTVTTITPDQASSILASASPSPTTLVVPPASSTDAAAAAAAAPSAPVAANNAASGATSVVLAPGGPNMYTGPVSNGALDVIGWTTVQAADVKL
ncbi:ferritin-like domain-containing protein [Phanerochaete sordida]|uniref:Ferritin-like domain-containing protein n=1 Tax=Phanerochaete sordida TaxID=48140 RepID=A0A9P3L892_9APHY|nr:ferritin-like domain-containing protein [Phanerochaete sordida]